jgi:peptide/nickel transport system substrate-binding protein
VFQPEAAEADPTGFSTNPIGTGPFVMQTRDLDNETVVVRNENYWMSDAEGNQLPYLDSVVFRPIPDEGTRLDSLLSGTVNAMHTLRQGTIRDARSAANDNYTLLDYQGNNTGGGMFNTAVPPFDDVRVRRGLVTMINQDVYIQALGGEGISEPATQWFSPDSVWYSEAVADVYPSFDLAAGQTLLEEYVNDPERSDGAAPGSPIAFDLGCPPDPTLVAAMQVLEQLWSQSGLVEVSLSNLDQQAHINRVLGAPPDFTGEHEAVCWRWGSDADPSTVLGPALGPPDEATAAEIGVGVAATNFPNYWNPDVYQAIQDARATDDFDERKALYETVMMALAEEVPVWYSGHTATMFGVESDVMGLDSWVLPDGSPGVGFPEVEGRWSQVSIEA